jgi:hypothetical protein
LSDGVRRMIGRRGRGGGRWDVCCAVAWAPHFTLCAKSRHSACRRDPARFRRARALASLIDVNDWAGKALDRAIACLSLTMASPGPSPFEAESRALIRPENIAFIAPVATGVFAAPPAPGRDARADSDHTTTSPMLPPSDSPLVNFNNISPLPPTPGGTRPRFSPPIQYRAAPARGGGSLSPSHGGGVGLGTPVRTSARRRSLDASGGGGGDGPAPRTGTHVPLWMRPASAASGESGLGSGDRLSTPGVAELEADRNYRRHLRAHGLALSSSSPSPGREPEDASTRVGVRGTASLAVNLDAAMASAAGESTVTRSGSAVARRPGGGRGGGAHAAAAAPHAAGLGLDLALDAPAMDAASAGAALRPAGGFASRLAPSPSSDGGLLSPLNAGGPASTGGALALSMYMQRGTRSTSPGPTAITPSPTPLFSQHAHTPPVPLGAPLHLDTSAGAPPLESVALPLAGRADRLSIVAPGAEAAAAGPSTPVHGASRLSSGVDGATEALAASSLVQRLAAAQASGSPGYPASAVGSSAFSAVASPLRGTSTPNGPAGGVLLGSDDGPEPPTSATLQTLGSKLRLGSNSGGVGGVGGVGSALSHGAAAPPAVLVRGLSASSAMSGVAAHPPSLVRGGSGSSGSVSVPPTADVAPPAASAVWLGTGVSWPSLVDAADHPPVYAYSVSGLRKRMPRPAPIPQVRGRGGGRPVDPARTFNTQPLPRLRPEHWRSVPRLHAHATHTTTPHQPAAGNWSELQLTPHSSRPKATRHFSRTLLATAPSPTYAAAHASASTALPCPVLTAAPAGAGGCHLRRSLGGTAPPPPSPSSDWPRFLGRCPSCPTPPPSSPRIAAGRPRYGEWSLAGGVSVSWRAPGL